MLPNSENKAVEKLVNLLANTGYTVNHKRWDDGAETKEVQIPLGTDFMFLKLYRPSENDSWILSELTTGNELVMMWQPKPYENAVKQIVDEIIDGRLVRTKR